MAASLSGYRGATDVRDGAVGASGGSPTPSEWWRILGRNCEKIAKKSDTPNGERLPRGCGTSVWRRVRLTHADVCVFVFFSGWKSSCTMHVNAKTRIAINPANVLSE